MTNSPNPCRSVFGQPLEGPDRLIDDGLGNTGPLFNRAFSPGLSDRERPA
jgi:hypothetical protein